MGVEEEIDGEKEGKGEEEEEEEEGEVGRSKKRVGLSLRNMASYLPTQPGSEEREEKRWCGAKWGGRSATRKGGWGGGKTR